MTSKKHLFLYDENHFTNLFIEKKLKIDDETSLEDFEIYEFDDKFKLDKGDVEIFNCSDNNNYINKLGVKKTPSYTLDINGDINFNTLKKNNIEVDSPWNFLNDNIFYNDGNVGIGTNTPLETLHIESSNPTLTISNDSIGLNQTCSIKLGNSNIVSTTTSTFNELSLNITSTDNLFHIDTDKNVEILGDLNVDDTLIVDNTNKRVGIKETSPSSLIDINQSSNGAMIRLNTQRAWFFSTIGSGSSTSLILQSQVSNKAFTIEENNSSNRLIKFQTGNNPSTSCLTDREGRVGINTNNPTEMLEVDGNILVSGRVYSPAPANRGMIVNSLFFDYTSSGNVNIAANTSTDQTIRSINYTPLLSGSWLIISFHGNWNLSGYGQDYVTIRIKVDGTSYMRHEAIYQNAAGGGGRGQVLPITCVYFNGNTNQKTITLTGNTNFSDDNMTFHGQGSHVRVLELPLYDTTNYTY